MHSNSDTVEVMSYDNVNKIIREIFESHLSTCRLGLQTSMRGNNFILDQVSLLF